MLDGFFVSDKIRSLLPRRLFLGPRLSASLGYLEVLAAPGRLVGCGLSDDAYANEPSSADDRQETRSGPGVT